MTEVVVQKTAFNQEYNTLLDLAKQYLQGKDLNAPVLLSLVAALAGELNQIKALKPAEKKELLCKVVESALENALTVTDLSGAAMSPAVAEAEQVALRYVVKNVVPSSVDLLVAASTGSLNLKAVKTSAWSFCQTCVPVVAARARAPAWAAAEAFVKKVQTGGSLATAGATAVAVVTAEAEKVFVADLSGATVDVPQVVKAAADAVSGAAKEIPDWAAAPPAVPVAPPASPIATPSLPPAPAQNDPNPKM
jgi:hypothetical protein